MRRLAATLAVSAGLLSLPFGATSASACAPPDEGPATCCQPPELIGIDVAGQHVGIPDPTWKPWLCE